MLVRVMQGTLKPKDKILLMANRSVYDCEQVGVFTPKAVARDELSAGGVGFIIAGIKEIHAAKVGDTVTLAARPADVPLPGFKDVKPQVFAGLYPVESNQYEALRDALDKLKLNDASLHYEPEVSQALGFGFRCGFLGLLHMDIVQERLEREYDMDLITTAPTVIYQVLKRDGTVLEIENPSKLPDLSRVEEIREPIITATILMPQDYVGPVLTLCTEKRGVQKNMQYLGRQVMLTYELPLAEVVMDFFDKLKSVSRGYASLDYEFKEFRAADVVKLDILINGERVDALSVMVHRVGRDLPRPRGGGQDAQADPAADVRRRGAGVDRRQDHRPRDDQGDAQERARQVLRRRHHAQEEAAREAEGRQEADEGGRQRRDPAGGVPRDPAGRRQMTARPSRRRRPPRLRRPAPATTHRSIDDHANELRAHPVPRHARHRRRRARRPPRLRQAARARRAASRGGSSIRRASSRSC